ncbi:hypothetical protein [Streptomyces sp. NBC_01244]|uniref:hypothetical protein n=1 Tax=Streptomyces sp. NBC_01244 TaxID=2903797 RepID=UPI002E1262E0|nr:hypothetical protein OG247_44460 [Streptomyces sp. NBC_01244]
MTNFLTSLTNVLSGVSWGPVSGWLTLLVILMAAKNLRITARQDKDNELKPARLVTLVGSASREGYRHGDLHVILAVSNDAEGPIVDCRPLIYFAPEGGCREALSYGMCGSEDDAEHRILGGQSKRFSLHFPADCELGGDAPFLYGLEFTDMAGLRWRRIGGAQPTRLVGADAEVCPLVRDFDHAQRGNLCS